MKLFMFFFYLTATFAQSIQTMPTESMAPAIYKGQKVKLVEIKVIHRGDVVYYNRPDQDYMGKKVKSGPGVGRIIGMPGDKFEIKESIFYINGSPVKMSKMEKPEKYSSKLDKAFANYNFSVFEVTHKDLKFLMLRDDTPLFVTYPLISIPGGKYFISGDNYNFSYDSKTFGPVDIKDIPFKVEVIE